eukprot:scaffold44431_cov30-Phaeocystis_antarctica.AAC.1
MGHGVRAWGQGTGSEHEVRARGQSTGLASRPADQQREGDAHEGLHEEYDHHAEGVEVEVGVGLLSHEGAEERACSGLGLGF